MSVQEGAVTALIGGNGAGKTTLFNIISGFERNYDGRVYFDGQEITGLPAYRISRLGIGRLFQGRQLMGDLTLMENMKIASSERMGEYPFDFLLKWRASRSREAAREKQAKEILSRVFGPDCSYLGRLNEKASDLSFGEQRLIAMARLLMGDYKLLLLDEPTSGVHPRHIGAFRNLIRHLVEMEGKTVLLVEHNMGFVRSVADCACYLADGRIIRSGKTDQVLEDPVIRRDYLGL